MTSRIRFRVHNHEYPGDTILNESFLNESFLNDTFLNDTFLNESLQYTSTSDALFAIMNMMSAIEPDYESLQLAIQNSEDDLQLRRREDIVVLVRTQSYDTTDKKYEECSICSDKYEKKEQVSVLDCGHVYHPKCIQEWGRYKTSCPVCMSKILFRYSNSEEVD